MATIITWFSLRLAKQEDPGLENYNASMMIYLFFIAMAELASACMFHIILGL